MVIPSRATASRGRVNNYFILPCARYPITADWTIEGIQRLGRERNQNGELSNER